MSSFWTPGGEHEVPASEPVATSPPPPTGGFEETDIDPQAATAMEQQMREAQEQLLSVPAAQVIANHVIGLFELAALHLRVDPPNLDEARLPIDAMGLIVDNLGDQLPDHAAMAAALQQIRMAYIQMTNETADTPADS